MPGWIEISKRAKDEAHQAVYDPKCGSGELGVCQAHEKDVDDERDAYFGGLI